MGVKELGTWNSVVWKRVHYSISWSGQRKCYMQTQKKTKSPSTLTNSQMNRTDKFSQHSSVIWLV